MKPADYTKESILEGARKLYTTLASADAMAKVGATNSDLEDLGAAIFMGREWGDLGGNDDAKKKRLKQFIVHCFIQSLDPLVLASSNQPADKPSEKPVEKVTADEIIPPARDK